MEQVVLRYWAWLTTNDDARRYVRLWSEAYGLALRDPERFPELLQHAGTGAWIEFISAQLGVREREEAEGIATCVLATVNGLLLDLLGTNDLERTTRALRFFAQRMSTQVVRGAGGGGSPPGASGGAPAGGRRSADRDTI